VVTSASWRALYMWRISGGYAWQNNPFATRGAVMAGENKASYTMFLVIVAIGEADRASSAVWRGVKTALSRPHQATLTCWRRRGGVAGGDIGQAKAAAWQRNGAAALACMLALLANKRQNIAKNIRTASDTGAVRYRTRAAACSV